MSFAAPVRRRNVLPGFGLTLGLTLVYLSVIVLFPLGVLVARASSLGIGGIWNVALQPRVLAALRTTFGISFAAAAIDVVFGGIVAWASLTASTLTDRYAREFGPQLKLIARGSRGGAGLEQINGQLRTDNAMVQVAGLIDPRTSTAPKGLQVSGQVKDVTRLIGAPQMGLFTADGVLAAAPKGWSWKGKAGVDRMSALGYDLSRIAGPVVISQAGGDFELQADLQGSGGKGAGLFASAAGSSPHATLAAARLPDGRMLMRSLKAKGDGLSLDAQGQRALFGALSFTGDLKMDRLAAGRAGAHGGLAAHWSASADAAACRS